MAEEVIASTEARARLPHLIEELLEHPDGAVGVGRQRRREVVILAASRYDEMVAREEALNDLAWAVFAQDRIEHPTSEPVSWEAALARRESRRGSSTPE